MQAKITKCKLKSQNASQNYKMPPKITKRMKKLHDAG